MVLRVVLADDERPARAFLASLLAQTEDVLLVGEATNGAEAVELIERAEPDLALLDLQMPEVDGLEAVRLLDKRYLPLVAFVTAYDEYAVRAFDLNAVDYLLKPVSRARLAETLRRARERLASDELRSEHGARLDKAVGEADVSTLERLPVRKRDEIVLVPVASIVAIESEGELLHITTEKKERHTVTRALRDLEARLPPDRFLRLSRSALVSIDAIETVSPMPGGTYLVTLKTGQKLAVSRQRSKDLREKLLRF